MPFCKVCKSGAEQIKELLNRTREVSLRNRIILKLKISLHRISSQACTQCQGQKVPNGKLWNILSFPESAGKHWKSFGPSKSQSHTILNYGCLPPGYHKHSEGFHLMLMSQGEKLTTAPCSSSSLMYKVLKFVPPRSTAQKSPVSCLYSSRCAIIPSSGQSFETIQPSGHEKPEMPCTQEEKGYKDDSSSLDLIWLTLQGGYQPCLAASWVCSLLLQVLLLPAKYGNMHGVDLTI